MEKPINRRTGRGRPLLLQTGLVGLGLISTAVYLFNFKLQRVVPGFLNRTDIHFFLFLLVFLTALYFAGVYLLIFRPPHDGQSKRLLIIIIFFAAIFRVFLVPTEPTVLSKDMYRYVWDGRVQQNHINPYRYPPSSEQLKPLRDAKIYPNINRKDAPTIYPAGAQLSFYIFHILVGDSTTGFKGLMVFFDMMTVLVLLALLRIYGFQETRIFIYAWNPLVIFEIAYSGHLEGLTVFLTVLAFYLNAKNKKIAAVSSLAFAAATKLYPALLLPALLNRGEKIKGVTTFMAAFLFLYLPFLRAGKEIAGFLPVYFKNPYESFNLGLKYLILRLFPGVDYFVLSKIFVLVLTAAGFYYFLKEKQQEQPLRCAYVLIGLLIILMPAALHPWYVVMLVPFLAFFPSPAWLIFTCTVALSYIKYVSPGGIMPAWVLLLEYVPLFALLAIGYIVARYACQSWVGRCFCLNSAGKFVE